MQEQPPQDPGGTSPDSAPPPQPPPAEGAPPGEEQSPSDGAGGAAGGADADDDPGAAPAADGGDGDEGDDGDAPAQDRPPSREGTGFSGGFGALPQEDSPPASPRRGSKRQSIAAMCLEGVDRGPGDANDDGVPDILEDGDDWTPNETWKVGQWCVVLGTLEKLQKAYRQSVLEWDPELVGPLCGAVGEVVAVVAIDRALRVQVRGEQNPVLLPFAAVRKVQLVPLPKPKGTTADELGLELRVTRHGGLQVQGAIEGEAAHDAGLGDLYGQWLTHVGDTPVATLEQFAEAEGNELRFERRVTLPYEFAKVKMEEKINGAILTADLRLYIIFVIFFCVFFLLDRDVEPAYYVTENMRNAVLGNEIPETYSADASGIGCVPGAYKTPVRWEKTFLDLANVGDWNAWVVTMALPSLWGADQFGPSVSSNILLGSVRFRVIRMRNDSCTVNSEIIPNLPGLEEQQLCYAPFSGPNDDSEAKGKGPGESALFAQMFDQRIPDIEYDPSVIDPRDGGYQPDKWTQYRYCKDINVGAEWSPPWTTAKIDVYHCGGYFFEVPFYKWNNDTQAMEKTTTTEAQDIFRRRACNNFFDNVATRLVSMELVEYTPTFDTFLSVKMLFEVAAGGAWIPTHQFRTFALWTGTTGRVNQTIFDHFFLLFVLYYVFDFFADARRQYRRKGSLLGHILQPWTILEFLNLSLFLASFGFRFTWWARCVQADVKLDALRTRSIYPGVLDEIEWLYVMQVYINSCNVVFTFLKLLKYMRLNARFGILTETLADCQDSIVGVLIIFILVVLAFAVTGNTLFGTQMYEFRSLSASFSTLMRMLMGEFDYEAMKRENRVLAGLFFWSFLVLGLFVLLNFLIGVIAESFGKVSEQIHTEPLDMVFKKTMDDIKVLCKPAVLKHYVRMRLVRHNTRESLLEDCIDAVEKWRELTYVQVPDDENPGQMRWKDGEEPECQIINRHEFLGAVRACGDPPGIVMEDIGEDYVGFIWNHLVYEFNRSQEVDNLQAQMRKQSAFQKGCKNALQDKLRVIENFSSRMDVLRVSLEQMKLLLVEKGAAT
eukprot:TRINITY_DN17622_c0_g1_i1.p1 TRINITY_DN17622_c0_g1~~TRINITY_DN17622_c0_g1_i1.p1  ORF type:complete len:1100 (+),score=417.78 TRINITY_DN17622_c0_g1_i1:134-3301(+)